MNSQYREGGTNSTISLTSCEIVLDSFNYTIDRLTGWLGLIVVTAKSCKFLEQLFDHAGQWGAESMRGLASL